MNKIMEILTNQRAKLVEKYFIPTPAKNPLTPEQIKEAKDLYEVLLGLHPTTITREEYINITEINSRYEALMHKKTV